MIQNRKKVQFNLLDVLIIILILGLIGLVVYGLFGGFRKTEDTGSEEIRFEVKISNVKEDALPFIADGIEVKNSVTGETIGTIVSVRTERSCYYGGAYQDENGDYILNMTEHPDEHDVYVTVSANAELDSRAIYYVGDIRILIGEAVYFQVKSFSAISYIVNVTSSD